MRSFLVLTALASTAAAATVTVSVGDSGLVFSPDTVTANTGDTIEFVYKSQGHTVTQGDFSNPCNPLANGFNSDIINTVGTSFSIVLTSNDPIYFYCAQVGHCQAGMVGAINPPSSGNTLAAYKSAASSAKTNSTPSGAFGGVISAPGGSVSTAPGVPTTSKSSGATTTGSSESSAAATLTSSESETETETEIYPSTTLANTAGNTTATRANTTGKPTTQASSSAPPAQTGNSAVSLAGGLVKAAVCVVGAAALLV